MATNQKPAVEVAPDRPPSYQLELEDIIVGRGNMFRFGLGKGQVIAGWDQGVTGMKVGGRRRITIPPILA